MRIKPLAAPNFQGDNAGVWAAILSVLTGATAVITRWWLRRADRTENELTAYRGELHKEIDQLKAEQKEQQAQIVQLVQEKGECMQKVALLEYQVREMQRRLDDYERQAGAGSE